MHGIGKSGSVVVQRRLRRSQVLGFFSKLRHASLALKPARVRIFGVARSGLSVTLVPRTGWNNRTARSQIMVVALARKLLIALWRFVTDGTVPEGAVLKRCCLIGPGSPACAANAEQSGDPRERHRCSAWRYRAVHTEWCRSLGALPVPNAGQWLGINSRRM